jgi:predicted Fe-Mo cluster-binding NifX family protein
MLIAIPLDDNKEIISELMATLWVVVDFDNGLIQSINYYNTKANINIPSLDFVILSNKFENYMEFIENGTMVLIVRQEKSIKDIIEAFKFKELDEVGI